jgi:predicted DCC family thiol-disulfide oxidoreductase YuxK
VEGEQKKGLNHQIGNSMTNQVTMFYDGGCPLCRREVEHNRRLDRDRRVRWIDISVQRESPQPFCLTESTEMARLHVLDGEGQMKTGVAAFVPLWNELPYYRWLALFVQHLGLVPLLERLYEPFARWRISRRRKTCPA